jgi:chaperone modulatory protein CbpM
MSHQPHSAGQSGEILGAAAFTVEDFARACGMATTWVEERVEDGILQVDLDSGQWRFDSITLVRARRIAHLEITFDADPQLAALTADLIDEVARLRSRLTLES